ncbi:hypothetical protein P3X83_34840 [Spongiactinospora sp. TRM90649]|nr:hypothetical protein [Spongiactinospora sp. TRM90649]
MLPVEQAAEPSPSDPLTRAPAPTPTATGQDTREALAETRGTDNEDLKVEVVGLNRVKGKHLVVQIRLSNTGTEKNLPWSSDMGDPTRPLGKMNWASGIGVLDAQAHTWIPAAPARRLPLPVQRPEA